MILPPAQDGCLSSKSASASHPRISKEMISPPTTSSSPTPAWACIISGARMCRRFSSMNFSTSPTADSISQTEARISSSCLSASPSSSDFSLPLLLILIDSSILNCLSFAGHRRGAIRWNFAKVINQKTMEELAQFARFGLGWRELLNLRPVQTDELLDGFHHFPFAWAQTEFP